MCVWKWGQAIFLLFPSALLPFWFISATVHTIQIDKHIQLLSAFNFSPLIKYRNWYRFYQKKYSNSRWKWNRNKSIFQRYLIEPKIREPCHYFRFLNIETDLLIEKASCHEHGLQTCRWVICQPDPTTQCQTGSCFSRQPQDPPSHLWPSSHTLALSDVLAWMPGLGGPCTASVLPQVTL